MSLAVRAYAAARSTAAMTLGLGRATGRFDKAALYAVQAVARRDHPVDLVWRGLALSARGRDWPALQEVLIEDEYGALTPFLKAKPHPVVLDLGANIGTFSLYTLSVAPGAIVHAFEPAASTFALLSATRARNPKYDWTVHRAAAWSADGTISFTSGAASTAGRVSESGDETVPTLSLDSILQRCGGRADVAKLDIEGAEEATLADADTLVSRIDTLVVELHPGRCRTERVVETLRRSYGKLYRIPGRRSSKPLLLATRVDGAPALPTYDE